MKQFSCLGIYRNILFIHRPWQNYLDRLIAPLWGRSSLGSLTAAKPVFSLIGFEPTHRYTEGNAGTPSATQNSQRSCRWLGHQWRWGPPPGSSRHSNEVAPRGAILILMLFRMVTVLPRCLASQAAWQMEVGYDNGGKWHRPPDSETQHYPVSLNAGIRGHAMKLCLKAKGNVFSTKTHLQEPPATWFAGM